MNLQSLLCACLLVVPLGATFAEAPSPGERLRAYGQAVDECFDLVKRGEIDCAQVRQLAIALDRAHKCQRELDQSEMEVPAEELASWKADRRPADERFTQVREKLGSSLASTGTEPLVQPKFEPIEPESRSFRGGMSGVTLYRVETQWGEEAEINAEALHKLLNELEGKASETVAITPVILSHDWQRLVTVAKTSPAKLDAVQAHLPSKALTVLAGQVALSGEKSVADKLRTAAADKALNELVDFLDKKTDLEQRSPNFKNELEDHLRKKGVEASDFSEEAPDPRTTNDAQTIRDARPQVVPNGHIENSPASLEH